MEQKRGMIWVVLVLMVVYLPLLIAQEQTSPRYDVGRANNDLVEQLNIGILDIDDCHEPDGGESDRDGDVWPAETSQEIGSMEGCSVWGGDFDETYDDTTHAYYDEGYKVDGIRTGNTFAGYNSINDECDAEQLFNHGNFRTGDENAYVCGPGHYWYRCTLESQGTYVRMSDSVVYNCTINPDYPKQWPEWTNMGTDEDGDGFISRGDTDHNGNDCDDNDPNANPGKVEIAGDNIDNDCDGVPVGDADDTPATCTNPEQNIFKESFSWIDGTRNMGCCGDDGIDDLGKDATIEPGQGGPTPAGNYLCISTKSELVGGSLGALSELSNCEGKNWCWVRADTVSSLSPILTIKKPGSDPYDVVSNNQQWYQCKAGSNVMPASPTQPAMANQFYCYNEGNKWSWAQCCWEGSDGCQAYENVNGAKLRHPGDGIYTLSSDLGENLVLDFATSPYHAVYGDNYWDFTGYDFLDFYVEYLSDTVFKPDQIVLTVEGPQGKFFQEDVLSYAINGPAFEKGKKMHVQIPIGGDWKQVSRLSFSPLKESNKIRITHVQVSKQGNNLVCSGEKLATQNSWLADLDDFSSGDFSGRKMCEALQLTWLGDQVDPQYRCCGDDSGEYFAQNGVEKGCWNSQGVLSGKTVTNIQAELTYGQGEWSYRYPEVEVSGKVKIMREGGFEDFSVTIPVGAGPQLIENITIHRVPDKTMESGFSDVEGGSVYLINPLNPSIHYSNEYPLHDADLPYDESLFYLMGVAEGVEREYKYSPKTDVLTYTCSQATCSFPLKGSPPYTIKNLHPEQYDLYFVGITDGKEVRILIDQEKTVHANQGWLEVTNVKQQVLFNNGQFLGCGEVSALSEQALPASVTPLSFCAANLTYFCDVDGSWSREELPQLAYDADNNLGVTGGVILPQSRNTSSPVVPGRNLLLNPWLGMGKR